MHVPRNVVGSNFLWCSSKDHPSFSVGLRIIVFESRLRHTSLFMSTNFVDKTEALCSLLPTQPPPPILESDLADLSSFMLFSYFVDLSAY